MNTSKQNFLAQFTHASTRAFASALYDLEQSSKSTNKGRARERVLDIVDFDTEIDEKELKIFGLEMAN